jgi:hypothetical protein
MKPIYLCNYEYLKDCVLNLSSHPSNASQDYLFGFIYAFSKINMISHKECESLCIYVIDLLSKKNKVQP